LSGTEEEEAASPFAGDRAPASPRADLMTAAVLLAFGLGIVALALRMPTFVEQSGTGLTAPGIVPGFHGAMIALLALALGLAEAVGARDIFIGVNALDYSGYPDCRPEFIASFAETARLATKEGVEGSPFAIHAPLQHWGKARIAQKAVRLGLDPAMSWSCYDPTPEGLACGLCDSCRLRRAGFAEAGLDDPTAYAET